ncbi:MAG: DNA double-strand break repair nuclease NurA [Candidatus Bathyarchaeota archaeon]|nr:DNA double-strand break repair nuclease NurA [Candidatus Bathyarchaeota archaeon]
MIEQLHYATTSRYNFPQLLQDTELPKRLIELSLNSMHTVRGRLFQPYESEFLEPSTERPRQNEQISLNTKALSALLTPLKPVQDGTPVTGVDVSSIKIGETETGIIYAVRAAVVWKNKRRYRYLRLGPFPFHITEENKREIFTDLGQQQSLTFTSRISTLVESQSRLCNLIERRIQKSVSHSAKGNIILWDGSLTAGTPGNPMSEVSHILKVARRNSNLVLAFSKVTTIRFLGWRITDLVAGHKPPCLFEVEDLPLSVSKTTRLLGKIYVAKLASGGCSFRLDIDKTLTREQGIRAVERLLGNELTFQGYPETLRLAHIYSTFTATDVIGIQSFLTREYGLRVVTRPSIRKALFGPYGTGFED